MTVLSPEGGNIIFEYMWLDSDLQAAFQLPQGITTVARVAGYFMDHQTPDANPLPMPGQCNNLVATKGWPLWVGTPHTDLDVGTVTITGKNTAGTDVSFDVPKQPAGKDAFGRMHDIFYQTVLPDAKQYLVGDSGYTVKFGGAGSIPATTFQDGIFLAHDFQVTTPTLEDNGPMVAGQDYTVSWTPATSANLPAGEQVQGLVWLADATGSPTHMCVTLHSAGTFKIPGSALTEYKQIAQSRNLPTNQVILLRQAVVHQIRQLPNNEPTNARRIDMLSVQCYAQAMGLQ